ncbi:type IVB secretion system protein IcmH/DotU [Candidatus Sororendozoicomonas aggregata]|uniref:type IVB secretion system protein IcmH/DotU n=1 Tax=Candidatus Sororendozoicomonas aggregata TaxID=3073239 RepID=UPI002ED21773
MAEQLIAETVSYRDIKMLLNDFSASSNPLINLSAELLAILVTLSQQKSPMKLPEFQQYLLNQIKQFHDRGLQVDYSPRVMEKACYALCAAFDEEIMNTAWGQAGCWENHCLVAQLFQQRNAGEVFFTLLHQARKNVSRMVDLVELQYLIIRLGFCGHYHDSSQRELVELMNALYLDISEHRKTVELRPHLVLSKPWKPLKEIRLFRLITVVLIILLAGGVGTHFWISRHNAVYVDQLLPLMSSPVSYESDTTKMAIEKP